MASLLRAAKKGIAPGYVPRLLAAVNKTGDAAPVQPGLIEPLSDRELDVLRLLGTDLNGPDIARELTVSLSAMRTHTNRIYAKARCEQPSGSGPPGPATRPDATNPRPLTAGARSFTIREHIGHGDSTSGSREASRGRGPADHPAPAASVLDPRWRPDRATSSPQSTHVLMRPHLHLLLPFDQAT